MTYRPSLIGIVSRTVILLVVGVAVLALAAEPAFAQMGTGRMQGQIKDAEGNGLEGVTVTAYNPDVTPNTVEGTSGSGGRWAIVGFARGNWTFTFRLDGYVAYEVSATVSAANRNPNLDVTLNPIPEGAGAVGAGAGATQPELFNEGTTMFNAGDYAGAVAKWQEFLAVNPTMFQVHGNIGNAYRELGDIDNARSAYEALIAQDPGNTMANYNLGEMLVEAGDIQAAMPYFETVVEASPDDPAVYYNVAELYFSERELEPAITYYKRAIEVDPGYLPAHKQLGFAYVNTGDIPNAILSFEKYVELAPADDPEVPVIQDVLAALRNG